jgi:hypothetical protein
MAFLYGNHVTKSGLGRMTEDTPQYAGVIVYSMANIPLGFGIAAQVPHQKYKSCLQSSLFVSVFAIQYSPLFPSLPSPLSLITTK